MVKFHPKMAVLLEGSPKFTVVKHPEYFNDILNVFCHT